MSVNGHSELERRRQSLGWLDERRHHRSVVLSRVAVWCFEFVRVWILHPSLVSAEQSEAAGAVVSRFKGVFISVARGAWLSFATSLGL
ncbi:hypothetical protein F2Q70_00036000 [Brassica cretica]|uniref:Uncharacterized protein n=1 Tax=Brassica cretica TaxID=69181 RepID=A0A3N6QGP4_BRACR|nr:hypothetical protein F2Q70_00036000 [Brassica cretica]KAF3534411.1 hypothetical protein DY000_02040412 [Brassica cretica]